MTDNAAGRDTPRVSICVVTYNQEKYIEDCLRSIVEQKTQFPFEIIVADDNSTDRTRAIVHDWKRRYSNIRVLPRERNLGPGPNFVDAHNQARGEYVCHMDGDDVWLPGKLQFQVELMDERPDCVQSWTCARLIDDGGRDVGVFPSRLARAVNPVELDCRDIVLSYALVGQHSTHMYRRAARDVRLIVETPLDYWVAFTIALSGKSYYAKNVLSCYRLTAASSVTRSTSTRKSAVDLLASHLLQIFEQYPQYREEAFAHLTVRRLFSRLRGHDCTAVDQAIAKARGTPLRPWLVARCVALFTAQKLRW